MTPLTSRVVGLSMPRGRSGLVLAAAVLFLAMSCDSVPVSSASRPAPTSSSTRFGAPVVTAPRDGSAYATSPCSLLTSADLAGLRLRPQGRQRTAIDVQECRWSSGDLEDLSMYVDPARDLLADTYRTQQRGYFVPTSVDGLPAVRQKSGRDQINICTVTTGLGPKQALETTWIGKGDPAPGNDACEFAEQATALVVRKLPPQR